MADLEPITHLEKSIAGETIPVTHLEKVIAKYGGGGGGGGDIDVDTDISADSRNPVENRAIAAALEAKADAADIADFMTENDVETAIEDAVGDIVRFEYYLCGQGEYDPVTGEPTVQGADTNHIYLTPTAGTNLNMYAYINNAFTFLGTTEVDLDGYATTADVTAAVSGKADANHNHDDRYYTESEVDAALANKADADHNHDSRYYTETEVDTKLGGKSNTGHTHAYSEITGTPTIPVVPSNIVVGSTKSYTIVVSNSAPAAGTADNIITIVV